MLLTEGFQAELAETKVGVTIVFPSANATNIAENSGVIAPGGVSAEESKHRATAADAAACTILDAIERDAYRVNACSNTSFLDLFYRLAPWWAAGFIAKQMATPLDRWQAGHPERHAPAEGLSSPWLARSPDERSRDTSCRPQAFGPSLARLDRRPGCGLRLGSCQRARENPGQAG